MSDILRPLYSNVAMKFVGLFQEPGGLAEAKVGLREHPSASEADLASVGSAEDVASGGRGQDADADGHRRRAAEVAHGQGGWMSGDEFDIGARVLATLKKK